jgi:hypothetical protein
MTTIEALEVLDERPYETLENDNPHWAISRYESGYRVDYWYCDDPDCDCQQTDIETRESVLKRFPDDSWH